MKKLLNGIASALCVLTLITFASCNYAGDNSGSTLTAEWTAWGQVSKPSFSLTSSVDYGDKLVLSCTTEGAEIYYTTDGSNPKDENGFTATSAKYDAEIEITSDMTVKAIAVKNEMTDSEMCECSFAVKMYEITFANGGHGTAPGAITGKHKGEVITLPAALTESGWLFKKWTDGTAEYDEGAEYEVSGNVTMTAVWEVDNTITYTLPENGNGGLEGTSTQRQGDVATATWLDSTTGNIKINGTAIAKTSEVVAIPTGTVAKINMTSTDETGDLFTSTRKVKLSPFVMSKYLVTRGLFKAVMGEEYFTNLGTQATANGTPDENPVTKTSWFDAIIFCNKLSAMYGLAPVYSYQINGVAVTDPDQWITGLGAVPTSSSATNYSTWKDGVKIDLTKNGYRLPTEAEWEFCARGGDPEKADWKYTYSGSNTCSEVAWCDDYNNSSVSVDDDKYKDNEDYVVDPLVESVSHSRGLRGGSWCYDYSMCGCGCRRSGGPYNRNSANGFRLVRSTN